MKNRSSNSKEIWKRGDKEWEETKKQINQRWEAKLKKNLRSMKMKKRENLTANIKVQEEILTTNSQRKLIASIPQVNMAQCTKRKIAWKMNWMMNKIFT